MCVCVCVVYVVHCVLLHKVDYFLIVYFRSVIRENDPNEMGCGGWRERKGDGVKVWESTTPTHRDRIMSCGQHLLSLSLLLVMVVVMVS